MYAICKISGEQEFIIKFIKSKDTFMEEICKIEGYTHYQMLDNVPLNNVTNDQSIKVGFYLLKNGDLINLIEKCETLLKGYIYNSTIIDTKIVDTYKLVPIKISLDQYHNQTSKTFSEFNFDSVPDHSSMGIIGSDTVYKQLIVKSIMNKLLMKPYNYDILMISSFSDMQDFYKNTYPTVKISGKYNDFVIDEFMKNSYKSNSSSIIVLDIGNDYKNIINSQKFTELIYNSRCYKINLILLMPNIKDTYLPPQYRCNIDYVFILPNNDIDEQKRIWFQYCGIFSTLATFTEHYDKICLQDCNSLVVCNRGSSENIQEKVFYRKL